MRKLLIDLVLVLLFATLTAVGGSIKIPFLPYHPNTPQLIPIILSGALLGSTRGPLSQIAFIFLGIFGLPLFNELAPAFPVPAISASPYFIKTGLKAGWLFGFVAASYLAGKTLEYAQRYDIASVSGAVGGGLLVLYLAGVGVPVLVLQAPLAPTFLGWLWPFFIADLAKGLLVVIFLMNIRRVLPTPAAT